MLCCWCRATFGEGLVVTDVLQLLRRYDWSLADPLNPPRIQNPGVWVVRNFGVRVAKR